MFSGSKLPGLPKAAVVLVADVGLHLLDLPPAVALIERREHLRRLEPLHHPNAPIVVERVLHFALAHDGRIFTGTVIDPWPGAHNARVLT